MKSRPKILIVTHTDPATDPLILKIYRASNQAGFNSKIIGIDRVRKPDLNSEIYLIKTWSSKLLAKKLLRFTFIRILNYFEIATRATILIYKNKPQLIYCNDWVMLPMVTLSSLFLKFKIIYHAHELESETQNLNFFLKKFIVIIEKISWKYISYFITVNDSIKNWYLLKYGCKQTELVVNSPIYHKVLVANSNNSKNLRDIYKISTLSNIFVFVGNLDHGRGIAVILEAFSRIDSDACVIFIGDGPLLEIIKAQKKYGVNIFHHNRVEYEDLILLSSTADFGLCLIENVSLSDYFSLPNKLFEYSFANLFILATPLPEIKNLIDSFSLGSIIDLSPQALVAWIEEQSKLNEKRRPPNSQFIKTFEWKSQEKKIIKILQTVHTMK
jgi:glycosyltransferase involved in cell wall biosynthesis